MTYNKPTILSKDASASLILTGTKIMSCNEAHQMNGSSAGAYEVDE